MNNSQLLYGAITFHVNTIIVDTYTFKGTSVTGNKHIDLNSEEQKEIADQLKRLVEKEIQGIDTLKKYGLEVEVIDYRGGCMSATIGIIIGAIGVTISLIKDHAQIKAGFEDLIKKLRSIDITVKAKHGVFYVCIKRQDRITPENLEKQLKKLEKDVEKEMNSLKGQLEELKKNDGK